MKTTIYAIFAMLFSLASNAQPNYTLTVVSTPTNSKFAYIMDGMDHSTHATSHSVVIARWTSSGSPFSWRSFLQFDLSAIPAGSIIDSAYLSLYANATSPSGNPGNPTWGSANAVGIYRITGAWDTTTLAWATQPAYAATNADTLPQSTSTSQNYLNRNVTKMVQDMYALGNYGFLLKHIQEISTLNSMIFYSPNAYMADVGKTPKLVVYYRNTVAVTDVQKLLFTADIYPNPASGVVNITMRKNIDEQVSVAITDCAGKTITNKIIIDKNTQVSTAIDLSGYAKGLYIIQLRCNGETLIKKLIVE